VNVMAVLVGVLIIVGAAVGSFAIPPHRLFRRLSARPPLSAYPKIPDTGEETR
jgi:hypothetical protein